VLKAQLRQQLAAVDSAGFFNVGDSRENSQHKQQKRHDRLLTTTVLGLTVPTGLLIAADEVLE
jgi:hypothetical protein